MGVRVHLPLQIRWPGDAPPDSGPASEALDAALERGLGAALGRVRGEIFAPRGSSATPRPLSPTFEWRDGEGLVDGPARALLEARVAAAIRSAVADHPLVEDSHAPEVLPDGPSEPVDWQRMRGLDYRVHSYDGDPDEIDLTVESSSSPETSTSYQDLWWHWNGTDQAFSDQMNAFVRAFHSEARSRFAGALFHGTRDGWTGFWAAHLTLQWDGDRFTYTFRRLRLFREFQVFRETGLETRSEPAAGVYTHELVQAYSSPDQLRTLVRQGLLGRYGLLDRPAQESASRSRLRTRMERSIQEFVEWAGGLSNYALTVLRTPNGAPYYLATPVEAMLGHNTWSLQGLWETVQVEPAEGAADGAAGTNAGGEQDSRGETGGEGEEGGEGSESGSPLAEADGGTGTPRANLYPRIAIWGDNITLDLSPFLEEPHVDQLFGATVPIKRLIRRIAYRLEMPEGEYCGAFLIAAARMINARANLVGQVAVTMPRATQQVPAGAGNLGDVNMVPEHTPAIELMRFIGGTCPLIRQLTRLMSEVYSQPRIHRNHFGRYKGNPTGWLLHFHMEHTPEMERGIGFVYMRACQVTMLQMLRSSAQEISVRLDNFERYFPVFEGLILGFVASEAELRQLRDTLTTALAVLDPSFQHTVSVAARTWREARRALSSSISDQVLNLSEIADGPDTPQGRVFRQQDGSWAIRDPRGRAWTLTDLESAIAIRSQTARSIDPLISQLTDIPDVVDVFRNHPEMARFYLRSLLTEMRDSNTEITDEVTSDYIYAFRSGKIREDLPNRTVPGCRVALQGIHLLAHQAIGDAFEGDGWYGVGLDWAFTVELGRLGLISFFETSLVLGLSVLCPPAGAILGVVLAGVHYAEVGERFEISRAVMNPEELYDRAEIELDLFMAELEIVLSILPEIGSIGRGVARGANVLGRYGVRAGVRRLGVEARRQLLVSMARQVKAGLPRAFVAALLTDRAMAMVLPHVLGPVIEAVDAEIRMMTARRPQGNASPARQTRNAPPSGDSTTQPTSPQGIAFFSRLDEYRPSPDEEVRRPPEDQP